MEEQTRTVEQMRTTVARAWRQNGTVSVTTRYGDTHRGVCRYYRGKGLCLSMYTDGTDPWIGIAWSAVVSVVGHHN